MAKLSIHYHLGGGRVRTIDLSPPNLKAQYQDLLERLMAALSRSGHKTSDTFNEGDHKRDPEGKFSLTSHGSGGAIKAKHLAEAEALPAPDAKSYGVKYRAKFEMREALRKKQNAAALHHADKGLVGAISWRKNEAGGLHVSHLGSHHPGAGSALMDHVEGLAKSQGTHVTLHAEPEALEFYKHRGYELAGGHFHGSSNALMVKKFPSKTHDDAEGDPTGHWITMSGAHVFINGAGLIIKGPAHMVGKNKNDMADTAQAKPVEPAKGVKGKVHQLLTTGHLFSFDELKNATGAKLDQQLHNAINELKAGKGAHGQLSIQKVGKHYQVINEKGDPMPGLPKTEPDPFADFKLPAGDPALAAKAPKLPDYDVPLEWEPGMPEEMKAEADIVPPTPEPIVAPSPVPGPPGPKIAKAPAEPMSKADADKAYAEAIKQASEDAAINVAMAFDKGVMDPDEYNAMLEANAKHWKEQKSMAMAQWAANYKGGDHSPKPVEVFPADKKLMEDLAAATEMMPNAQAAATAKALAKWKEDTAKAKAAIKNPPPLNPGKAAAMGMTPVKEDTTPTGGHTLSAPESIVPADHKGITADDFAPDAGQSQSPYVKDISELHKALHASASKNASTNKANVQKKLEERLKVSPHFQTMQEQYAKKMGGGSLASNMIQAWASSSGDHHARSVANQLAIRDVFGMHPDDVETKAFHIFNGGNTSEEDVYKQAASEYGIKVDTPARLESFKAGCRDFALAQYHETQDHLKKLGISEVSLVRGMKVGSSTTGATHGDLKLQPASSFSTAHSTAHGFAGGHSLFVVKVPASQVFSSFVTGFGCTSESEVVVLAHKDMKAIKIGTSHAPNATTMSKNIAEQLGAGTKKPTKTTGAFKPKNLPKKPVGAQSHLAAKLYTAAMAGDMGTFQDLHIELMAQPGNLSASKGYANKLAAEFIPQHEAHVAALEAKKAQTSAKELAKAMSPAKPVATTSEGVKKNAHYYKKLKEKILAHPLHTEENYKMGKSQGMTNEQILAQLEKVHAQNNKEY